jgi:hypothetical protein
LFKYGGSRTKKITGIWSLPFLSNRHSSIAREEGALVLVCAFVLVLGYLGF